MQYNISEISVIYRPSFVSDSIITHSEDSTKVFREFIEEDTIHLQEHFLVMYLNQANRVLGIYRLSKGGITGTVADIRLILSVALKTAATSLILAHNHPSGNLRPSNADLELTARIKEAAKYMDIRLLDHIILSPKEGYYYSFADEGVIF